MTLIPAGAQLGPTDLPPPPPASDPREPSPTAIRGRTSRTPQRTRSPAPGGHTSHSRGPSPSRPPVHHAPHTDPAVPIASPIPRQAGALGAGSPIPPPLNPFHHSAPHLSRPSSPSSIHSSTSAIFERDIELPAVASLSINPNQPTPHTLSHKASRLSQFSHGSPLDHTVPAVLDDAVEALAGAEATSRGLHGLEIEAPAHSGGVGMARQSSASLHNIAGAQSRKVSGAGNIIQLGSRSPSPVSVASRTSSGVVSPAQSPPILSQLATHQAQQQAQSAVGQSDKTSPLNSTSGSVPRPAMASRISTGPQLPGGWAFSSGSATEKPQDGASLEGSTVTEEPTSASSQTNLPAQSPSPPPAIPSHLTPSKDKRRISFISYNDLLLSVPTTVTPLEDITSGNLSPDHLPGTVSPNVPTRSPIVSGPAGPAGFAGKEMEHKSSWDAGAGPRPGGLGLGEGEWQREGLGRGLEQRLEDLAREDSVQSNPGSLPVVL